MLSTFLSGYKVKEEIYNRLLKVVQEFIITHYHMDSEKSFQVHWPIAPFTQACQRVNENLDMPKVFAKLQGICRESGWRLTLSGPDWNSSGYIICEEGTGARDFVFNEVMSYAKEPDAVVVITNDPESTGNFGFSVKRGKRNADGLLTILNVE